MIYPLLLIGAAYLLLMGKKGASSSLWKQNFKDEDFGKVRFGSTEVPALTAKAWPILAAKLARVDSRKLKLGASTPTTNMLSGGKIAYFDLKPGISDEVRTQSFSVPMEGNFLTYLCQLCQAVATPQNPASIFIRGAYLLGTTWPEEIVVVSGNPTELDITNGGLANTIFCGSWADLRSGSPRVFTDAFCKGEA